MGDETTLQVITSPLQHGVDDFCTPLVRRRDLVNPIIRESDVPPDQSVFPIIDKQVHNGAIATLSSFGPLRPLFW
jgi:hypothetical protein